MKYIKIYTKIFILSVVVLTIGIWIRPVHDISAYSSSDIYTSKDVATLLPTFSLSNIDGVNVPFRNGIPVSSFERQNCRIAFDLGGTWKYQRMALDHTYSLTNRSTSLSQIEAEANGRHASQYDDSSWGTKNLPAVENIMPDYEDPNGPERYEDGVWYRRTFVADSTWSGKYNRLVFCSVNYIADVWINGTWVGYHEGGYTPFDFDISSLLNYGGSNTIALRVDNIQWGTRTDIVPAVQSDWMNYTGVIQDVYLEVSDQVNIVRADVKPLNIDGDLTIQIPVFNKDSSSKNVTVELAVYDTNVTSSSITDPTAQGIINNQVNVSGTTSQSVTVNAGATRVLTYSIGITNPNLWSPKYPNLYVLKATLKKDGNFVEDFYTQFGVRTLGIGEEGKMLLNNHATFLVGVARHEDWSDTGRTATMAKIKNDLDKIKAMKVNFIRTAHYPNHPYTYILSDRMGFAIMEEIPAWWFGTYEWADQNQRKIIDQMWREMIFRDYNRPSIILWSACNEGEGTSVDRRRATIERLHRDLDVNFNDGRFVTQSASADRPGPEDTSQNAVDVAAWTMYFGVFHGGTCYQGTLDFLDAAHANFPDKPILNTEFGYWSQLDDSEASEQNTVFNETFDAFEARQAVDASGSIIASGFVAGTQWWTAFNWYTQLGEFVQTMGAIHMDRTTNKLVHGSIQTQHSPYYDLGGLSTSTLTSTIPPPPSQTTPGQPDSVPAGILQDFEYPDSFYNVFQAEGELDTAKVYSGQYSLKMVSTGDTYHTIGVYIYNRPVDVSSYSSVGVWIYDTVGQNTLEIRLTDSHGDTQAIWTNQRSLKNRWKLISNSLASYTQVDLTKIIKIEFCEYWEGTYYFDDAKVW
mgnify:CR=1 FL=1